MKKLKRDFFFWIEKLQITRKERIVISGLVILVLIMTGLSAFINDQYQENTENYEAILKEFEEKALQLKIKPKKKNQNWREKRKRKKQIRVYPI